MKNKTFFKINLIYFVAIISVAIVFLLGYLGILQNEFLTTFLIQIVVMLTIPLLLYSLLMKKNLKSTLDDIGLKKITAKMVALSILLGFVLYFINSFVADAFASIIALFGYETLPTTSSTNLTYGLLFKELLLSCALPGICEEVLHRGILLHANRKHTNTKFCLVISSLLFGLTHLNIRQFFYASILGALIGYTTLVANSIIPGIIIHFMNNFLSNYFYYGSKLNWPLANFVNSITSVMLADILLFVVSTSIIVILLFFAYLHLTKQMFKERKRKEIQTIVTAIKVNSLTIEEAQMRINHTNELLKSKNKQKTPCSFLDKTFLISSIVLGSLITISSFIWGVI